MVLIHRAGRQTVGYTPILPWKGAEVRDEGREGEGV
jgi:hypothetical protein